MMTRITLCLVLTFSSAAMLHLAACESLPGSPRTQGAVVGGVGGAAIGAIIARENRLLGALIGGAVGAGGGYLIGAQTGYIIREDTDAAERSAQRAVDRPAQPADVRLSTTADLNNDGFVTLDEVVAMHRAGLDDEEMIRRLEATGFVFELTEHQERFLLDNNVSERVVREMREINQSERERLLAERDEVIGQPRANDAFND